MAALDANPTADIPAAPVPRLNRVIHEGQGPYALLVHGALGSRSYWAANVWALAEVCRPVVVELWGHGRSPSPTEASWYAPQAYIEQFELLRQELNVSAWVTIGQSMGAALTLRYGLTHPERVLAQVITNSSSAFSQPDAWRRTQLETATPLAEKVERRGAQILVDSWVNPGRSKRVPPEIRELLAAEFAEHTGLGIANSLRHTNSGLPLGERLAEVSHPTLMTLGVDEETFLPLMERARLIPGLEVAEMAAAHAVNAQAPDAWNRAAVTFLRRVLDPAS
ncbi:MAG: alpha/beta fold hydrolase [Acidimicrobiales bacterium]